MEIAELVLKYIQAAAWPVVAVIALLAFRKPLHEVFNRISQVNAFGVEMHARDKGLDEVRGYLLGLSPGSASASTEQSPAATQGSSGEESGVSSSTASSSAGAPGARKQTDSLSSSLTPSFMGLGPGEKAQELVKSHPAPGPFVAEGEGWRYEKHAFLDAYNRATRLIWDTLHAFEISPSRLSPRTAEELAAKTQVQGWNALAKAWDEVDEGDSVIVQITDPEERSRFLAKWLETTYLFEKKFLEVLQAVADYHSNRQD